LNPIFSEAQKKLTVQQNLIASVQADLHLANLDIRKKETKILALTAELESVQFKFEQESKGWAKQLTEQDNALSHKDAELVAVKSLLEEGTAALQEELNNQMTKVCFADKVSFKTGV
jgi:ABC-type arginine transport system ATPase subunit